jgi:hypothetical protein
MRSFFDALTRRRTALVVRSSEQRAQVAAAVARVERGVTAPALVGAGVALTLLSASPQLRSWAVRGWAAYALIRRLLGR